MRIARVGLVIGAGVILEVIVGGVLVLEALMGDRLSLLQLLLMLVVVVQLVAFGLWVFVSARAKHDVHADRARPRAPDRAGAPMRGLGEERARRRRNSDEAGPARDQRDRANP
jgi:hypothetical protein